MAYTVPTPMADMKISAKESNAYTHLIAFTCSL